MNRKKQEMLGKVPEVTLIFWIIKILATTLGETGGDAVTMSIHFGYLDGTAIFAAIFIAALGDWTADTAGIGYEGGAIVFGAMLAVIAAAHYRAGISHTVLFWGAFILTRPLGAVVGDFLDKPFSNGGLNLSRYAASAALLLLIAVFILLFSHKSALPWAEGDRPATRHMPQGCHATVQPGCKDSWV